jgi:FkbM family methyltransferase
VKLSRVVLGLLALAAVVAVAVGIARREKPLPMTIPGVGQISMYLNPDDRVITDTMRTSGIWEPNETHWFVKSMRPGDVVIDAGANVGWYTILASKLVGPTGRVYAFEPDPTAFALLQRNIRENGADNVVAEQKALSNENTTLELFIAGENKGDDRIYQPEGENRPSIKVPAVRLDDYLRGKADHVDFMKMDTQGAEGVILEGSQETLRANAQLAMIVEYWPSGLAGLGSDPAALLKLLRGDDFRFWDLGGYAGGPEKMTEVDDPTLLAKYTVDNRSFTNLFCVKGLARSVAQPANDKTILPNAPPPGRAARARG